MSDSENQVQTMDDLLKISNLICYDDNVKAGVGTLTFEVCSKMKFIRVDTIKGEIKSWLLGNFLVLKLGTQVDICECISFHGCNSDSRACSCR